MAGRPLAAALLLLVLALAGCTGRPQEAADPRPVEEPDRQPQGNMTPPDNRSGELIAFQETNATSEGTFGQEHAHDYWNGQSRLELFTEQVRMPSFPNDDGSVEVVVDVPPPALVLEGTATVEVTVRDPTVHGCALFLPQVCTPEVGSPAPPAPLALSYLHAATSEWIDAGAVPWGQTLGIVVDDPRHTDMPHSSWSLWRLRFRSAEPRDVTLGFTVSVAIVRGADVPPWPGHPEFYAATAYRIVYEGDVTTANSGIGGPTGGTGEMPPARLISWGTRSLYVYVNLSKIEAGGAEPTHWRLEWHNASGVWRSTSSFNANWTAGNTSYLWVLPVDDLGMDSPYAERSRWGFRLDASYTSPRPALPVAPPGLPVPLGVPGVSCLSCFPLKVDYHLRVVATNQTAEAYSVRV